MSKLTIFILTLSAFFAATGQLFFKIGAKGKIELLDFINIYILLGLLFYGAGTAIWIYTLAHEKLVNVYSFAALTFVLVYVSGTIFLDEKLTFYGFVGILFVLLGLYFITQYN